MNLFYYSSAFKEEQGQRIIGIHGVGDDVPAGVVSLGVKQEECHHGQSPCRVDSLDSFALVMMFGNGWRSVSVVGLNPMPVFVQNYAKNLLIPKISITFGIIIPKFIGIFGIRAFGGPIR